ncbi:MAG: hypothetical protein JO284_07870 [Planctomycetaceae bacterium]|nr:hypothetical protein [Planctomycetaceae bacterium]
MHVTPDEFEVRVEALVAGLPEPAAARAELLAWARASIVALEARLEEVEESARRDRELAVAEALFDSRRSGTARLRAELAQDRVPRTSLQEVRRLQRERGGAADAGATDRAAGSGNPAASTEANLEAEVRSMTAEAAAPTEANLEAVGPVTQVDIAAPIELDLLPRGAGDSVWGWDRVSSIVRAGTQGCPSPPWMPIRQKCGKSRWTCSAKFARHAECPWERRPSATPPLKGGA